MRFNGVDYRYVHNLQGDIVGMVDSAGATVIEYRWDAWGKLLATTGTLTTTLGALNPFRYRGYLYDAETELYYLQIRYYKQQYGKFLGADRILGQTGMVFSHNIHAYCRNSPIMMADPDGDSPLDFFRRYLEDTLELARSFVKDVLRKNSFTSADAAAEDFGMKHNSKSISENREYIAAIYTICLSPKEIYGPPEVRYAYAGTVIAGTKDSAPIPSIVGSPEVVAVVHTHGAYDPMYASDIFSFQDINIARRYGIDIYVATPAGTLRKFTVSTSTDVIINSTLPRDPNHP